MRSTVSGVVVLAFAGLAAGCDSSTAAKQQSIAITLSTTSLAVGQGSTTAIVVTIERTNFEEPVTLAIDGTLPLGITTEFALNPLPAAVTTTTLTVRVASNSDPVTGTFAVRAAGQGVTDQSQSVDFTVGVTGSYSLGVLAPTITIAQGGGGTATVLLARTGGNGGNVALAVNGLPAGVTATVPQSTTDRSAPLALSALGSAAAGTYEVTIASSQAGITPDQSVALTLVVIPPPATTGVTIPFCAATVPVWFAYQNEGFAWQQVTPSGATVTFAASDVLGVAYAFAAGSASVVFVLYVSRGELEALDDIDCRGTRDYTGSVSGLTTGQSGLVIMGSAAALAPAATGTYQLSDVADRPLDLVATRGIVTQNAYIAPDRIIIRRGLDLPTNSAIPALDFTAAEAFAPGAVTLTMAGAVEGEVFAFQSALLTATNTYGTIQIASTTGTTATLNLVPPEESAADDLHQFFIQAFQPDFSSGHSVIDYSQDSGDRTATLGPPLETPSASTLAETPYARLRGTLPSQSEYATLAQFEFAQQSLSGSRSVVLAVTAAYLGAPPPAWDLVIPDFTGTAGFNQAWMLAPDVAVTQMLAEAFSGRGELLFGSPPTAGEGYRHAFRVIATSTAARSRAGGVAPPRGGTRRVIGLPPQYLRR